MKKVYAVIVFMIGMLTTVSAQKSENYAVKMLGTPQADGSVEVAFQTDQYGKTYTVRRMEKGKGDWGTEIKTYSGVDSSGWIRFVDDETEKGKTYEYTVYKTGVGNFVGMGYLMTGVEVPAVHDRGVVLLLVDEDLLADASAEIDGHVMDIAADGWNVEYITVSNANNTVPAIRKIIDDQLDIYGKLESIYLLGNIAVPYSGQYCNDRYYTVPPDGHGPGAGDHCGAWPADVYYAVHDGFWADEDSITQYARRAENQNIPGDGKFDQIEVYGTIESQLGRVDLSNLSNFSQTESELIKRYIQKNHDYRYGITEVHDLALVDENFSASIGAFASTAWRNFPSLIGIGKTESKDFLTTLKDSTYILAYGAGAGSYRSCANVAKSTDMVDNNAAIFNFLFGSYFGDWDNANNFLRTILATEKGGLTNAWSGRPWWHLHPMGMGESIGYCTRISQSNSRSEKVYEPAVFGKNIHIALMGDPTLRMYNFDGASNLSATVNSTRDEVELNWSASPEDVDGYFVYYSWSPSGPFVRVNHTPLEQTSFTHSAPFDGDVYYMVRAQRLETTPSGSFYNLSQGVIEMVDALDAVGVHSIDKVALVDIYPNPVNDILKVKTSRLTADASYSITDIQGRVLLSGQLNNAGQWNLTSIDMATLMDGVYFIQIAGAAHRLVKSH